MKNYKSNLALVNAYATCLSSEGKANNMSFRGATIYSYGEHFPIATRTECLTFFNGQYYSNTTAKHKSLVRSAIANDNIVECMYVPTWSEIERNWCGTIHVNNMLYWNTRIANLTKELENPRNRNKKRRLDEVERLISNRTQYKKFFNL